jgi:hypothetical protein
MYSRWKSLDVVMREQPLSAGICFKVATIPLRVDYKIRVLISAILSMHDTISSGIETDPPRRR